MRSSPATPTQHELGQRAAAPEWLRRLDAAAPTKSSRASNGAAKVLVSNRNLLVIADVLAVNKGFAKAHPDMVRAWCTAFSKATAGCATTRRRTSASSPRRSSWSEDGRARRARARAPREPAGEPRVLRRHDRLRRFVRRHLPVVGARVRQRDQESRPIRRASSTRAALDALAKRRPVRRAEDRHRADPARRRRPRSRAIRCSARTSASSSSRTPSNARPATRRRTRNTCDTIKRFLQVSPGSTVLLRGHVDNARVNEFREQGGEQLVQEHGAQGHGAVASARASP